MPFFAQPWWLVALGIIPLIRWWHRRQAPLSSYTVSAILLWPPKAIDDDAGSMPTPPDPAWRRRALIAALLICVLAIPSIDREHSNVTVWVDDSPSMQAIENGVTRAELAENALLQELEKTGQVEASRRSLSKPYASNLDPNNAHWLLTDGAGEKVRDWAFKTSPDRVINVGTATENSAVTRLAVRRSLDEDGVYDVLISVRNSGGDADERTLQLWNGDFLREETLVSIGPEQSFHWQIRVRLDNAPIAASLSSGDALPNDDRLEFPAAILQASRVAIDDDCSAQLRSALESHPALVITESNLNNDLLVTCSNEGLVRSQTHHKAQIHVIHGSSSPLASEPVWMPFEKLPGKLRLPLEYLRAVTWPTTPEVDSRQVVLRSVAGPLILATQSDDGDSRVVETVIDMGHREFGQQAEYAALVATLVDAALDNVMLSTVTRESRDIADTVIRPNNMVIGSTRLPEEKQNAAMPLSGLLLAITSILIGLDITLLYRSRRRARHV